MQQVFEQLIQGFVPKTNKFFRKEIARLRAENSRLLRELKNECSEELFLEICEVKRANRACCREDLKDMFSEGVLYGILAGIETACGFPDGKSLLAAMLYGQFADMRHSISSENSSALLQKFYRLYDDAEKNIPAELFRKLNAIVDNDSADIYSYTAAYYAEGMRKGISLGIAAGELAKKLPLG